MYSIKLYQSLCTNSESFQLSIVAGNCTVTGHYMYFTSLHIREYLVKVSIILHAGSGSHLLILQLTLGPEMFQCSRICQLDPINTKSTVLKVFTEGTPVICKELKNERSEKTAKESDVYTPSSHSIGVSTNPTSSEMSGRQLAKA